MSTTLGAPIDPRSRDRGRTRVAVRAWLWVTGFAVLGFLIVGAVLFAWMANEIHFDRPSPAFDRFAAQLDALPGVESVEKERWVEVPTFSDPTSWMGVTVDEAALPALLDAACSTDYADTVTWSIRVQTPSAAEVSLHSPSGPAAGDARCPDFGFDAVRLVDELDRVAPGLAVQPSVWDAGILSLVALEDRLPSGFTHLLPLVEHADDLTDAAGLGDDAEVEINSANLGFVLESGEAPRYLALISSLAADHAVTSYWADSGGTPIDGIEKVQVVAPDRQHSAIEELIRSSGLHIDDLPVRFIEQ